MSGTWKMLKEAGDALYQECRPAAPPLCFSVVQHHTLPMDIERRACILLTCKGKGSLIKKRYMYMNEDILGKNPSMCVYNAPSLNASQKLVVDEIPKLGKEAAAKAIEEWGQPKSKITHVVFCSLNGVDIPGGDYQLTKLLGLEPTVKRFMFYAQGCFRGAMLGKNPSMCVYNAPSLNASQKLVVDEIPKLGQEAAAKVIEEWGQPKSKITHVVFCNLNGVDMPGEDYQLTKLLGLEPTVKRFMFYALSSEITSISNFTCPNPISGIEHPLSELVSASQTILPASNDAILGHMREEEGMTLYLQKDTVPEMTGDNIKKSVEEAFGPLGISDWNSLFWMVHPGGRAVVEQVKDKLNLKPGKLTASRQVMHDYGNMSSATVLFVID
ncbi:hypothetical protein IFM89_024989 [Coptis chinensis]|uniref:Chalcone synthase n=1 Tax=Coptis chinensis TaxID=261450 RepID=A0A835HX70_9MAGN|nr:hypothetical protein IFM89_024989 [Coptis chinensis]